MMTKILMTFLLFCLYYSTFFPLINQLISPIASKSKGNYFPISQEIPFNPYYLPLLLSAFVLLLVFSIFLILSQFVMSAAHTRYKPDSSPLTSLNTNLELLPEFFYAVPFLDFLSNFNLGNVLKLVSVYLSFQEQYFIPSFLICLLFLQIQETSSGFLLPFPPAKIGQGLLIPSAGDTKGKLPLSSTSFSNC